MPDAEVEALLAENLRRRAALLAPFDPESGEGAPGPRVRVAIVGLDPAVMWLPRAMVDDAMVAELVRVGDLAAYCRVRGRRADDVRDALDRLRMRHDFPFWAARYAHIKCKGGGEDVTLRLTHPQRRFVAALEDMRLAGLPIRIVLLKARQWGGSTVSQLYMAWLQLVHRTGLNSLIIAHQGCASDEIRDMFDRMVRAYPARLLHDPGEAYSDDEVKMRTVGRAGASFRVPQRNCKVKIGTAERPDSCRGGDYNLVHLSEVGMWRATQGKRPEDIVRAACAGVLYRPDTMIVYESTANGIGNFFHREYLDARDNPRAQFRAIFIPWYDIELYQLDWDPALTRRAQCGNTLGGASTGGDEGGGASPAAFARWLIDNRDSDLEPSCREESGRYLWWLWERGATLEGIRWYIVERSKHASHGSMAAECPTDDTEAFVNSGAAVFDKYLVEALRPACRPPAYRGEVVGAADTGEGALRQVHFVADGRGAFSVWHLPDGAAPLAHRYLVVVDIGGRSLKADWSVIVVIDRAPMADGGKPEVVAQWYGHIDMDLLAWRAAQVAQLYGEALLVIESNTLETRDPQRQVDGDQSLFILNQIRDAYHNIYARRRTAEDVRLGLPCKYGFHTNVSTKPMVISTLIRVVREAMYVERDERCLNEMLTYERKANGAFGAILGAHDDLLMTRAIGLHICFYEMPLPAPLDPARRLSYAPRTTPVSI